MSNTDDILEVLEKYEVDEWQVWKLNKDDLWYAKKTKDEYNIQNKVLKYTSSFMAKPGGFIPEVNLIIESIIKNDSKSYKSYWKLEGNNDLVSCNIVYEPKNNDGRSECFWCGTSTKNVEMLFSTIQVCSKCGK